MTGLAVIGMEALSVDTLQSLGLIAIGLAFLLHMFAMHRPR
jgi:hypothetical protein